MFDAIDDLGEKVDTPVLINETHFSLRTVPLSAADIARKPFSVEPGGPTVEFSPVLTNLLPENFSLVLANINSDTIGSRSQTGLSIGTQLFIVSTGIEVKNLSEPIMLSFPLPMVRQLECLRGLNLNMYPL